jgi:hypothetical protein
MAISLERGLDGDACPGHNGFVATYPGQSNAHLARYLAYTEIHFYESRTKNRAAIEARSNSALKSAQAAEQLGLQSVRARQAVESCKRRLEILRHNR